MNIKIEKFYWERANLHIKINQKVNSSFLIDSSENTIPTEIDNDEIILAFYNISNRDVLKTGTYRLQVNDEILKIDPSDFSIIDNYTRIFRYHGLYSYTIELSFSEDHELCILADFWEKDRNPKSKKYIKEPKGLAGKAKNELRHAKNIFANIMYTIFRLFKNKKNVLFFSENEDDLSVNLTMLKEELEKRNEYKIRVLVKNTFKSNPSILYRLKELYSLAISDYIFVDNYTPILTYLNVSSKVKLIQVWHAAIGFKSVGYARFGRKGSPHAFISSHRKYTHAIVDSEELINVYKEVFGVNEDIFYPYGIPRLDNFLDKENVETTKEKLYSEMPELKDKKIILYAPTYRGKGQKDAYYDMDKIKQKELSEFCDKNNAKVLFQFHPFTNNELEIDKKYSKNFVNVTGKYNINDLLYITDIIITDYSSCAYEASLLDIPIIFYRYDKEEYEYVRGIHTADVFKSKNVEVTSDKDLIKALNDFKKVERKKIKYEKRNSCKKIIDEIFGE